MIKSTELSREDAVKKIEEAISVKIVLNRGLTNLCQSDVWDFDDFSNKVAFLSGDLDLGKDGHSTVKSFLMDKHGEQVCDLVEYLFYLTDEYSEDKNKLIETGGERLIGIISYNGKEDANDEWVKYRDELNTIVGFKIQFNVFDSLETLSPMVDNEHFETKSGCRQEYEELGEPVDFTVHRFVKRKYGERAAKLYTFFLMNDIDADLDGMAEDIGKLTQQEFMEKYLLPKD